jgi:hypothetical protein
MPQEGLQPLFRRQLPVGRNQRPTGLLGKLRFHDFILALITHYALKAKAQTLYTWNVRHFERFGGQISLRVREPEDSRG